MHSKSLMHSKPTVVRSESARRKRPGSAAVERLGELKPPPAIAGPVNEIRAHAARKTAIDPDIKNRLLLNPIPSQNLPMDR